ncbi:MAG: phosphopantetheine adenylyltransferase [Candidatus Bathyarchaeia archaeon]
MKKQFENVAVGGTFDLFHTGHKTLLLKAFEIGNHVLIGVTSDEYVKKSHKSHEIAPYSERLTMLNKFLELNGFLERSEVVPLDDSYGITLSNRSIDAIVVSMETEPMAEKINAKRKSLGLPLLAVVAVSMVLSEDHYPISSTRIWFEEIDRDGNLL